MTARTRSPFDNLVEGRTYQIVADGRSGRVQWNLFRYEHIATELDPGWAVWNQLATRETRLQVGGEYRASALAWLAEIAPDADDCVLVLPDGVERITPHQEP